MRVKVDGPVTNNGALCDQIIRSLPEWFGDPGANLKYVRAADRLESFVATVNDSAVGILTISPEFERSAEIVVIGVLPAYHRRGIGRALLTSAENHLRERGVQFLHLKTLDSSVASEAYGATRLFYLAAGYQPLTVLEGVWDQPCLQMIKHLKRE